MRPNEMLKKWWVSTQIFCIHSMDFKKVSAEKTGLPFPRLDIVYNWNNEYMQVKHGMKFPNNIQISDISWNDKLINDDFWKIVSWFTNYSLSSKGHNSHKNEGIKISCQYA